VRRDEREEDCGPITRFLESPFSPALFDFQTRLTLCSGTYVSSNNYRTNALNPFTYLRQRTTHRDRPGCLSPPWGGGHFLGNMQPLMRTGWAVGAVDNQAEDERYSWLRHGVGVSKPKRGAKPQQHNEGRMACRSSGFRGVCLDYPKNGILTSATRW
jgi:hypothetical protein